MLKNNASDVSSHNYTKIKINSEADLYNVVILVKSVFHKNYNHYHHQALLEKCAKK